MDTTFYTQKTGERRGGKRRTSWKPGETGNRNGRPKDDHALSHIMGQVENMTAEELLEFIPRDNPLGQQIAQYPQNVQVKWIFAVRWAAAIIFEPNGVLVREWLDRREGRVPFRAEFDGKLTVEHLHLMLDQVYGAALDAETEDVAELEDGNESENG